MSQQAAITLNTVVYSPAGAPKGVPLWQYRGGGVLDSFSNLTINFLTAQGKKLLTMVTSRVTVPVVATADSTCACTGSLQRVSSGQVSYWLDPGATAAERLDLFNRVKDLAASAVMQAAVSDLDPPYA